MIYLVLLKKKYIFNFQKFKRAVYGGTKSIWTMNAESARRIGHPAPFPEELPHRLIQLYSFTNDIILDPFRGAEQQQYLL